MRPNELTEKEIKKLQKKFPKIKKRIPKKRLTKEEIQYRRSEAASDRTYPVSRSRNDIQ